MLGSILLVVGAVMLMGAVGSGSFATGAVGLILIVAGAVLFWRTSATRAYLNQNKRR